MISKKGYTAPFVIWIIAGTIIPILTIAYYGITDRNGAFTFENITAMFNSQHLEALGMSLLLSVVSTLVCLVLAFPMAFNFEGKQVRQARFYDICLYTSYVDEFPAQNYGMASSPRETGSDQFCARIHRTK